MDCRVCDKNDSRRRYFCSSCVSNRLQEHYSRRNQLINILDLTTSKATDLLTPPLASNVLGVQDERLLKSEQWNLANKVRNFRFLVEKGKESLSSDQIKLNERRAGLNKRRSNLISARALLPNSNEQPTLTLEQINLSRNHHSILIQTEETRQILLRELLSVYAFIPIERVLPSPFKSYSSSSDSSSISSITSKDLDSSNPFHSHSHTLATLPLPSLNAISTTPAILLSATLNNLLHLIRLIALYLNISLPFLPLPTLYGPGRPGVKARADISDATYPLFTSPSSTSTSTSKNKLSNKSKLPSTTSSTSNSNSTSLLSSTITALKPILTPQSGGLEDESLYKELERRENRSKAVLSGSIALAFNLAYMCWMRGEEFNIVDGNGGEGVEKGGDELVDLGALIGRLMRTFSNGTMGGGGGRGGLNRNRVTPTILPPQRNSSENFPIEFNSLLLHFTTNTSTTSLTGNSNDRMKMKKGEGDDSTDEGWDLV